MRCAMGWPAEAFGKAVLAVVLAIGTSTSRGQIADMETYQENAGLTSMAVECLAQAADGTLWIGTDNGLFAFDGFRIRREAMPGDAGMAITDLQADRLGRLWVATDTGLQVRRDVDGLVSWKSVVRPDGVALGVEGKQRLTIDEHGAVFAMDRRSRIWAIPAPASAAAKVVAALMPLPAYEPFVGAFDADGGPIRALGAAIWFSCGRGVCRWLDGRLRVWGPGQGLPGDTWASLLGARDGSIWARGINHLARLTAGSDRFETVDAPVARLWPATIAMTQDSAGRIVTATDEGLARWDGRSWRRWTPREGVPETAVRALLVDTDGELWTGSAGRGLHRWIGYGRLEHWTAAAGLPSPVVWSFARDGAGQMRVATSHGVAGLDVLTQRFSAIGPLFTPTTAGKLATDDAGAVWWVDDGHVMTLAPGTRRARVAFRDRTIDAVLQASHSIVLSGPHSAERLVQSSRGLRRVSLPADMPDPNSLSAVVSDGQREWFLIDNGAYRIDRGAWEALRDEHGARVDVLGVATFAGPSAFWAVDKYGLADYQITAGVASLRQRIDAVRLGTADIEFVGSDRDGRLWIGTDRGVFVRSGERWTLLDRANGLLWNDLDSGAVFFDRDGTVWIGSSKGATHVLRGQLDRPAPTLRVEEIRFGDRPPTRTIPTRIAWADRRVRLTLQTPQIARGRSMQLEYRLHDTAAWERFESNVLQLESLESGDYHVLVRACASVPLVEPGTPLEVSFSIAPPWWRSTLARIAYAISLAVAWFLTVQVLRTRADAVRVRLERAIAERTAELERSRELVRSLGVHNARSLEEERKRVARELHDEMGQQLAALRMEISVLRRSGPDSSEASNDATLSMLLARVEGLVASMRGVVAQLRPPALDGGLAAALEWLVSEFERHADVTCDVDIDECARLLAPDAAAMVFRIAQESLNNVRRHAQAGRASLQLRVAGAFCELSIHDDGIGFDPSNRAAGYGILGMEERARALGGTLTISSNRGEGTTVRLRLPLPDLATARH